MELCSASENTQNVPKNTLDTGILVNFRPHMEEGGHALGVGNIKFVPYMN